MKQVSIETQKMLDSLRKSVRNALEKRKRLGQYAVTWDGKKPVDIDFSYSQGTSGKTQ